jgi:hypothetical protein
MTGSGGRPAYTRRRLMCVGALALVAGGLLLLATRQGVPLGADDAAYTGAARSLAAGHGLDVPIHMYPLGSVSIGTPAPGHAAPVPTPLVIYAPLDPVLLAVGGQHPIGTARIEDTVFLVLADLVIGLFVLMVTNELWLAAAAQLIVALSLANILSSPGSEAAALFFAVVALVAVIRYRDHPRIPWLLVGAAAMALATLERFAAGGLIVWGVLALRRRPRAAVALLVMSSAPLLGWFVYESVSGRSTGHFIGFHIVKTTVRAGFHSLAFWILPVNIATGPAVLGAGVVVAVVVVLLLRNHGGPAVTALVLFAVVQIVILEVAITFFDAGVDLDTREFIPVYAVVVMALACGVSRRRPVQVVTVLLVVACALRFGIDTATLPPGGLVTPAWEHSAVLADVRALPADAVIYTDGPDILYLLDGRATSSIPETSDFSTLKVNPRFQAQIDEIKRTLESRGGYVVYIRGLGRDSFLPTEATLRKLLPLRVVDNTDDGAIYAIAGR